MCVLERQAPFGFYSTTGPNIMAVILSNIIQDPIYTSSHQLCLVRRLKMKTLRLRWNLVALKDGRLITTTWRVCVSTWSVKGLALPLWCTDKQIPHPSQFSIDEAITKMWRAEAQKKRRCISCLWSVEFGTSKFWTPKALQKGNDVHSLK